MKTYSSVVFLATAILSICGSQVAQAANWSNILEGLDEKGHEVVKFGDAEGRYAWKLIREGNGVPFSVDGELAGVYRPVEAVFVKIDEYAKKWGKDDTKVEVELGAWDNKLKKAVDEVKFTGKPDEVTAQVNKYFEDRNPFNSLVGQIQPIGLKSLRISKFSDAANGLEITKLGQILPAVAAVGLVFSTVGSAKAAVGPNEAAAPAAVNLDLGSDNRIPDSAFQVPGGTPKGSSAAH